MVNGVFYLEEDIVKMAITVKRKPNRFFPDSKRVIARFYMPGKTDRAKSIIKKVLALSEKNANQILTQILRRFAIHL